MASPSNPPSESGNQARPLVETIQNMPLLGLSLDKSYPFMYHVKGGRPRRPRPFRPPAQVDNPQAELERREKLKASHIPATLIRIGSWQFASVHEADLVAKFYFASRKLVWEVLANGMKSKMEMQWSDISAIRATVEENKPGILEIELHQPPTFYKETDPQPRHHSIWISADDFTGGQAPTCRRHYIEFPSAALDRHYNKLLSSDRRLFELSQSGFPSSVETTFCTLQHFNCDEYPPRAIMMPQAHQPLLQSAYPPRLTPQQRQSYEAAIQQALLWKDSTPPMPELDSRLLENHRSENSQMAPWDQVSNNFSQFEALPPLHPAAAAGPALHLREDPYSPYVGEAGVPTLQTPTIMRNTQRRLFSTFPSHIGSPSAIGSTSNGDAMDVEQEHNGYANSSREFIIGPLEQNSAFPSPMGMPSAVGSASNDVAMGVRQEHDGYPQSNGQFIISPSEQNGTFISLIGSSNAVGSSSNGNAMDGRPNNNRQLIFSPSEQDSTFTLPTSSFAVGSASHGDAMGSVGQEYNGYASSSRQFNFGPSASEEQIYEQLASLMRKPHSGSPWR